MNRPGFIQGSLIFLLLGLSPAKARGDGGVIRLREIQGPFVVTIFTASEPLQDSPVDVSVMLQDRDSSDAILDATVKLMFTPPVGSIAGPVEQICRVAGMASMEPHAGRFTVAATRRQSSNKLLYAAPVKFGATGGWQLQAFIKQGGDAVTVGCSLPVGQPSRELAGLFPYLVTPPLVVALFAVNLWLRSQPAEKLPTQSALLSHHEQ